MEHVFYKIGEWIMKLKWLFFVAIFFIAFPAFACDEPILSVQNNQQIYNDDPYFPIDCENSGYPWNEIQFNFTSITQQWIKKFNPLSDGQYQLVVFTGFFNLSPLQNNTQAPGNGPDFIQTGCSITAVNNGSYWDRDYADINGFYPYGFQRFGIAIFTCESGMTNCRYYDTKISWIYDYKNGVWGGGVEHQSSCSILEKITIPIAEQSIAITTDVMSKWWGLLMVISVISAYIIKINMKTKF